MLGRAGRGEGAGHREERDLAALEIIGGVHLFGAVVGHLHQRGLGQLVSGRNGHLGILSLRGYWRPRDWVAEGRRQAEQRISGKWQRATGRRRFNHRPPAIENGGTWCRERMRNNG